MTMAVIDVDDRETELLKRKELLNSMKRGVDHGKNVAIAILIIIAILLAGFGAVSVLKYNTDNSGDEIARLRLAQTVNGDEVCATIDNISVNCARTEPRLVEPSELSCSDFVQDALREERESAARAMEESKKASTPPPTVAQPPPKPKLDEKVQGFIDRQKSLVSYQFLAGTKTVKYFNHDGEQWLIIDHDLTTSKVPMRDGVSRFVDVIIVNLKNGDAVWACTPTYISCREQGNYYDNKNEWYSYIKQWNIGGLFPHEWYKEYLNGEWTVDPKLPGKKVNGVAMTRLVKDNKQLLVHDFLGVPLYRTTDDEWETREPYDTILFNQWKDSDWAFHFEQYELLYERNKP